MAKPTAVTEAGGSKVHLLADSTATTPAAKTPAAVESAASGEATYPVGWQGVATHRQSDALATPGGFVAAGAGPVVLIAGNDDGTIKAIEAETGVPAGTEVGLLVRNIPQDEGLTNRLGRVAIADTSNNPVGVTSGRLNVDTGGGGGTSYADGTAFTPASTQVNPIGCEFDDTAPATQSEDTMGIPRMTANRAIHNNLRNASGSEIGTAGSPIRTDPTGSTTQPVSGTVTANAGSGTFTVSGTVTANAGSGTLAVGGNVAHDAADSGNPLKVGGKAATSVPTAVANGDRVDAYFDTNGRQVVKIDSSVPTSQVGWDAATMAVQRGLAIGVTATTDQTLLAADASNLYNVLDIQVDIFAGTAAPAAKAYVSIFHGTSGGTEIMRVYAPTAANGVVAKSVAFRMPDRGALNQAVTAKLNTALGTNGEYSVTCHAYKTAS